MTERLWQEVTPVNDIKTSLVVHRWTIFWTKGHIQIRQGQEKGSSKCKCWATTTRVNKDHQICKIKAELKTSLQEMAMVMVLSKTSVHKMAREVRARSLDKVMAPMLMQPMKKKILDWTKLILADFKKHPKVTFVSFFDDFF